MNPLRCLQNLYSTWSLPGLVSHLKCVEVPGFFLQKWKLGMSEYLLRKIETNLSAKKFGWFSHRNPLKRHSHRTFPQLSSAKKEALPARFSIDLLYKTDLAKSIFRFDRCSTPWCVPCTFLDPATTRIQRDESTVL